MHYALLRHCLEGYNYYNMMMWSTLNYIMHEAITYDITLHSSPMTIMLCHHTILHTRMYNVIHKQRPMRDTYSRRNWETDKVISNNIDGHVLTEEQGDGQSHFKQCRWTHVLTEKLGDGQNHFKQC